MKNRKFNSGFSLIEMLVATVLVLFLSAISYKILTGQGKTQKDAVYNQKQNTQLLRALDRFKKDASMIDYNWSKFGIATVYPHQGLGLNDNFYVHSAIQGEGLNDGVTFLKRDVQKAKFYTLSKSVGYPTVDAPATLLYGQWLELTENTTEIARKDWVLVYSAGKYALGVVTGKSHSTPAKIMIREPSDTEIAFTHMNSFVNRSSGYVLRAGVVPGSWDWSGSNTVSGDDNSILFEGGKTYVQAVEPVSYELDWATTDQMPAGTGNSHLMDENGNPKKSIVRTEYSNNTIKREYLADATQMGITYDVLVNRVTATDGTTTDSLNGFTNGDVAKDIGRENNSSVQFVNLISPNPNDPSMGDAFVSTSKIISLRMFLSDDVKSGNEQKQKFNEIRVALDPARINDQTQEEGSARALNSDDLMAKYVAEGQRIGQPLYLRHMQKLAGRIMARGNQIYVNSTNKVDVVVPMATIDPTKSGMENGKLLVLNEKGEPATGTTVCAHLTSDCEKIVFKPSEPNQYFLPSTMVEQPGDGTGMNKVLVGGFSVIVDTKTGIMTRKPMMAEIQYPDNMQFRDFVAQNNDTLAKGQTCSLGSSCRLIPINEMTIHGSGSRLRDTAGGFAVDGEDVYVASITRDAGNDGTLSIYKTGTDFTEFKETVVDNTSGISNNRVISAISQTPIEVAGVKYLPIATSRSIASGATPAEDGKILLYNLTNPTAAPIEIANHNFKVNSMTTMNGNLAFSGKLVTQVMTAEDIAALVNGSQTVTPTFYTDEIANFIKATGSTPAVKEYADGYFTLSSAYSNQATNTQQYQQVLGWNTGMNAYKVSDMEYGFVLGNQSYMHGTSPKPSDYQQQDFTTLSVNFGGMADRVVAAIDTNFSNLEASEVVTKFSKQNSKIPNVLLPGVMYASTTPRTDPAKLPELTSKMSENQWVAFYQDFIDITDYSSSATPIQYLPDPNAAVFQCGNSMPPTCGSTHGSGNDGSGGSGSTGGTGTGTGSTD